MRAQDVFVLADHTLRGVVEQITDDQWGMDMPPEFQRRDQRSVTLREIINYHAYDDAWVPDMLAGKTMDEAGRTNFEGDLLGDDPRASFARFVDRACAAALAIDDLDRIVHCSFGDFSTSDYLKQVITFRSMRAHDIAKVIGAPTRLPDDLVQGVWDEVSPYADEWRSYGVFGPRVEVPDDADLHAKLLGLTGRNP